MLEISPKNQILELQEQVTKLSEKLEEFTNPALMPDVFVQTLIEKGFLRYTNEITTFTNASGRDFISMFVDYTNKTGLINFDPLSSYRIFTANVSDVCTSIGHGLSNGFSVSIMNQGGGLPAPLNTSTTYYVINATTDTFKLATSPGGTEIDITTVGTGTHYILPF